MNVLERALVEKAGREHGWENIVESVEVRVVLGSARRRGRAIIRANEGHGGWRVELPEGRLTRELDRTLPGCACGAGRFDAPDMDTLAAVLRRAAELSQSLPDQAAETYRERAASALAAAAANGTEVERLVRQRVGQDVFREALLDYWGGACAVTGLALPEERWLGFFGHDDKWTDCCTFPLWKEQIRCEDRDETIPLPSRPG